MTPAFKDYILKLKHAHLFYWEVVKETNTHFIFQPAKGRKQINYILDEEASRHMHVVHSSFFVVKYESSDFCYYAAVLPIDGHGYFTTTIIVKDDNEPLSTWEMDSQFRDEEGYACGFLQDSPVNQHVLNNAGNVLKEYLLSSPQYRLLHVTGLLNDRSE